MNIKMDILIIFNNILHLPYTCILTIDSSFLNNKLNWDEIDEFAASLVKKECDSDYVSGKLAPVSAAGMKEASVRL